LFRLIEVGSEALEFTFLLALVITATAKGKDGAAVLPEV